MKIELILICIFFLFIGLNCSNPYPEGYLERFDAIEESWGDCYRERFHFPNGPKINSNEYLMCNLDAHPLYIDNASGFTGTVRYVSTWTSSVPNTSFEADTGLTTLLDITFLYNSFSTQITLEVEYPQDSLNYGIQQFFQQPEIELPSNFTNDYPRFFMSTYCGPNQVNSSIDFSSAYSLRDVQKIQIDSFSYRFNVDKWFYHLEYSFDEVEITNGKWNSRSQVDILGKKRTSDIYVENLLVSDLKCVIEFELPPD